MPSIAYIKVDNSLDELTNHKGQMRPYSRYAMRRYLYLVGIVILTFLLYRIVTREQTEIRSVHRGYKDEAVAPKDQEPKLNSVNLEIYMESQCPDTSRFMHKQMMPAWEKLSHTGRIDLTIIPFGKARCVEKRGDYECSCQHGPNECTLNTLMNCVIDRIGYPDKYLPIIDCIQGKGELNNALRQCIDNSSLLDTQQMRECTESPRGRKLLALSGSRTASLKPAINFIPWIMIDGERNTDAIYDLTENLCKKLEPAPEECSVYVKKDEEQNQPV